VANRYFIFLSYKGTFYHGWQHQPNSTTVQKILDEALTAVLREEIKTIGAGRTDTGVHAKIFCAHFDSNIPDLGIQKNLVFRLNSFLPKDISVSSIKKVRPDSSARFSAKSRTYKYYITNIKDPFNEDSSWHLHGDIDLGLMNEAALLLQNYDDFTSFSRLHSGTKTNICKIFEAGWREADGCLIFTIRADRFLRNMVRAIVGTLTDVGFRKISPGEFEKIIVSKDRGKAGKSAPAKGLFLTAIDYPQEIFL
jgi:tRNA pseudouridine38-40 synthase